MRPYKIAVCLSGEPRTWKSCANNILEFYKSNVHDIMFFGHTWTESAYSKENTHYNIEQHEVYDKKLLYSDMKSCINYCDLLIEDKNLICIEPEPYVISFDECSFGLQKAANLVNPNVYVHMSYSIMMANWLKTKYEIENEMRFDLVIRARHDNFYMPGKTIDDYIPNQIEPTVIYGSTNTFPMEFWQNHFNDVLFFGSSRVMNTVCDFYRYYSTGKFWDLMGANWNDPYIKICGYNVCLYKWLNIKNIRIREIDLLLNTKVFRKKAEKLSYTLPDDLDSIIKIEDEMFK